MAQNRSVRNKSPVKETMWDREKFEKIYNIGITKPPLDKSWPRMSLNLIHTQKLEPIEMQILTWRIYWKKKKSENIKRDSGVKLYWL